MKTYRQYKNYSTGAKITAWCIDLVGGSLYKVFQAPRKLFASIISPRNKGPLPCLRNFLLIRLDHIGDLLMTTPAIHALKQRFPESSLSLLVSPTARPIIDANTEIEAIFTFKVPWYDGGRAQKFPLRAYWRLIRLLRKERFDMVIDFRGDARVLWLFSFLSGAKQRVGFADLGGEFLLTRSCPYPEAQHFVAMNLALINCLNGSPADEDVRLVMPTTSEDAAYIDQILTGLGLSAADRIIAIHPATVPHWHLKRWAPERFAALADALAEQEGVKIVFTGTRDDLPELTRITAAMKGPAVVLAGKTSLSQLAELIKRCRLFIANDTGPMHIAAAVQTPLVAIFGPTDPRRSGPYGNPDLFRVVRCDVLCRRPCFVAECPIHHECMNGISLENVIAACQELLHFQLTAGEKT